VISFGSSVELCGGCHVATTGQIGFVKIRFESGVAAGIRRIEAISSTKAFAYFRKEEQTLQQVRVLLKNTNDPVKNLQGLLQENDVLSKNLAKFSLEKIKQLKQELIQTCKKIGDISFISAEVDLEPSKMKDISFEFTSEFENLVIILGSTKAEKANLSIGISKDLVTRRSLNADMIIREIAKEINGGGGGQAFFASAGGGSPSGLTAALKKMENFCEDLC
jgi:alanyl-tRNA synthetase